MTTVSSVLNGANNSSSYPLINILGNSPLSALSSVALDLGNNATKWADQDQKKIKEDAQRQANASFLNKQLGLTLDKDVDPDLAIKILGATAKDNKVTHTFKGADGNMYGVRGDGAALNLGVKAFNEDKQNIHYVTQPDGNVAAIKLNLDTGQPQIINTGVKQYIQPTYSPEQIQQAIANNAGTRAANTEVGKNIGNKNAIAQDYINKGFVPYKLTGDVVKDNLIKNYSSVEIDGVRLVPPQFAKELASKFTK